MTGSTELRRGARYCVCVFLAVRLAVSLLSVVGIGLIPVHKEGVDVPGWPAPAISPGWHNAFTALERQDAQWFFRVADDGYRADDGSAAFFPLYPLLVRVVSLFTGGRMLAAGVLVSNLSFLAALVVLFALTSMEQSEQHARTAVLLVAIFPTSLFFLAPYSESTFLLLSVAAFWCARRDRWALAALAAALAAATRSIGVALAPALLIEAVQQHRERGVPVFSRAAAAMATLLGPFLYFGYWAVAFGDGLAPLRAQQTWHRVATLPGRTLADALWTAYTFGNVWIIDVAVVGVVLVCAGISWWRLRAGYAAYATASLLVPLSYPFPSRPLLSVPRFAAVIFPSFWVLADLVDRRRLPRTLVVAAFAGGLSLLTVLFVNWYDIF
ncbi:MAG: mannosyltransferase family protein [Actinomycetota bacterium]